MSLSLLGRLIGFVLLAGLAAWGARAWAPELSAYLAAARGSTQEEASFSDRALVYRLPREGVLTFAFSQPVTLTKILVDPSVKPSVQGRVRGFVYGLELRLFDHGGQEIARRVQFLQAAPPRIVFATGKTRRFFRNRPELVAEQEQLLLESPHPAARIEIALVDPDPAMVGIDVRVYEQSPFFSTQPLATFRRLSERAQRELAAAIAFGPQLLTREEMESIALNRWRPLGPLGIGGRDFQSLVLYETSREIAPEETP